MQYEFTSKNVDHAPDKPGVYALYYGDEIIYYGWAQGDTVTIRSRLQSHKSGREGAAPKRPLTTGEKLPITQRSEKSNCYLNIGNNTGDSRGAMQKLG